jgi:hypothetical protein
MIAISAGLVLSTKSYPGIEQQSDAFLRNALSSNRRFVAIALGKSLRDSVLANTLRQFERQIFR